MELQAAEERIKELQQRAQAWWNERAVRVRPWIDHLATWDKESARIESQKMTKRGGEGVKALENWYQEAEEKLSKQGEKVENQVVEEIIKQLCDLLNGLASQEQEVEEDLQARVEEHDEQNREAIRRLRGLIEEWARQILSDKFQ